MRKVNIVLVGGGTGGHFYPLIAIGESLRAQIPDVNLYYAGTETYDAHALTSINAKYTYVPSGKQRRYRSILNYFDLIKVAFGAVVAVVKLYIIYPDVVVSKGGYTSVPVVLAATFLRIPVIIHESDAKMGAANRLATKFAHTIVVAYDELGKTLTHPRVHTLGIPIRRALMAPPTGDAIQTLGISPDRPLIFVIGGSQGADRINRLVLDSLDELLVDYSIIHQTGKQHYDLCVQSANNFITDSSLREHYHPMAYLDQVQMNNAYHLAQIIVSRAGSNSIYEIALHGKPSIIIPIPEEVSHDQRTNAYAYARTGAAIVIEEKNLGDNLLRSEIDRIMQDTAVYDQMSTSARAFGKTDVAERISDLIVDIAQKH